MSTIFCRPVTFGQCLNRQVFSYLIDPSLGPELLSDKRLIFLRANDLRIPDILSLFLSLSDSVYLSHTHTHTFSLSLSISPTLYLSSGPFVFSSSVRPPVKKRKRLGKPKAAKSRTRDVLYVCGPLFDRVHSFRISTKPDVAPITRIHHER